jgi:ribose/xylose/arabinose/galactoside ABC-type transport system permease subunit
LVKALSSPAARALLSLLVVFALGLVFNADGAFLKWDTHRDMLRQVSVYGILACGMTLVIISGGIDLSVGSILGLTAVVFSLFSIQWGWSSLAGILATLTIGILCGIPSGVLVARFGMQPFIATLAMMVFARGVAKYVSGGQKVSTAVPRIFQLINARVLDDNVAVVTILLLACIVVCGIILSTTPLGRYLYAIGGNEEAARLAGIRVSLVKVFAYAASGLFSAIAGICQAAQELQGDPEAGATYELSAIAIVVVGGTSLRGGTGSIWLTLLGVLTIGYLEKILSINAIGEETRLMLTGLIIVLAVLIQRRKPN